MIHIRVSCLKWKQVSNCRIKNHKTSNCNCKCNCVVDQMAATTTTTSASNPILCASFNQDNRYCIHSPHSVFMINNLGFCYFYDPIQLLCNWDQTWLQNLRIRYRKTSLRTRYVINSVYVSNFYIRLKLKKLIIMIDLFSFIKGWILILESDWN